MNGLKRREREEIERRGNERETAKRSWEMKYEIK